MTPLLSICIPTYNRCDWIGLSLRLWLKEIAPFSGQVEIIVSDNASTDVTAEIMMEFKDNETIRYNRNETNVGFRRNAEKVTVLAKGKFVWLVGDDDLPLPGCLSRLLPVLKRNDDLALVVVNYKHWDPKKPPLASFRPEEVDAKVGFNLDHEGIFGCIGDVIEGDLNSLTNIYVSVWSLEHAREAFKTGSDAEIIPFESRDSILPHSTYIAQKLCQQRGYFLREPCVLASYAISWSEHLDIYLFRWLPENIDLFVAHGVDSKKVVAHKICLIKEGYRILWSSLRRKRSLKLLFSMQGWRFFLRNRSIVAFYAMPFILSREFIGRRWQRLFGKKI